MSFLKESKNNDRSVKIENHIGIYDGFILDSDCDKTIKMFEDRVKFKQTFNRVQSERMGGHLKNDEATDFYYDIDMWHHDLNNIVVNFDMCLKNYENHTSIKDYMGIKNFEFTCFKVQKTLPTQGYHMWHVEKGPGFDNLKRGLVYTIYLNDIDEGGETEFLNHSVRVKPKKGRVVIWPAGFPYVHRGNPPLKDTKYILTSWMLIPSD